MRVQILGNNVLAAVETNHSARVAARVKTPAPLMQQHNVSAQSKEKHVEQNRKASSALSKSTNRQLEMQQFTPVFLAHASQDRSQREMSGLKEELQIPACWLFHSTKRSSSGVVGQDALPWVDD